MSPRAANPVTMPGRDVLALVIADLDSEAEFGREIIGRFRPDEIDPDFRRRVEITTAFAIGLRALAARAAQRPEDMPKGKDGQPSFTAKLRHETTMEILQLLVGGLRSAYIAVPPQAVENSDAELA